MSSKIFRVLLGASLFVFLISSCSQQDSRVQYESGLVLENMDTTVSPKEDFYQFVNGTWVKNTEIPPEWPIWGGIYQLYDENQDLTYEVLQSSADNPEYAEGSDQRKALDFFSVGMDSARADQLGNQPLQPWLEKINAITDLASLQDVLIDLHIHSGSQFFGAGVSTDQKNTSEMITSVVTGGIGLPDRDYYLVDNERFIDIREKYLAHVTNSFVLAGFDEAAASAKAQQIYDFEKELAEARLSRTEARDVDKTYNKMSLSELQELADNINWADYFSKQSYKGVDSVVVSQPAYMERVNALLEGTDLEVLKAYMSWGMIRQLSSYLSNEFVQASFDFYNKELRGTQEMQPRWKRVLSTTNGVLGEAIGKVYVDETFPPEAKERAISMVNNVLWAMGERIKSVEWMSDSTKEKGLEKLETFVVKIGYPDTWKDYSDLTVEAGTETSSYATNYLNAQKFSHYQNVGKLGKPVDKTEWGMSPQTVNAYYRPTWNEIVFPAAILQPPVYNYKADDAVNYGAMGAVIGHEISHGFDDQGSKYDAQGNLNSWWTDEDRQKFEERSQKLVEQFNQYEVLDSMFINGQLTLGENIGDLAGVLIAYDAFQKHMEENGRPGLIDGFTPEQRFFMSFTSVWRTKTQDAYMQQLLRVDTHSPNVYRAIGTLANVDAFYEAFDIKEGDAMYVAPEDRVRIW